MKFIGLALLLAGGFAFSSSGPELERAQATQHAVNMLGSLGNNAQQFVSSVSGITPEKLLMLELVHYGGLLAAVIGVALMIIGSLPNRHLPASPTEV